MARTKLKFRLHRAVIVLFCLALLVALMQGASWFSQNHQRQRNPQLEETGPHPGASGDAERCTADAYRLTR